MIALLLVVNGLGGAAVGFPVGWLMRPRSGPSGHGLLGPILGSMVLLPFGLVAWFTFYAHLIAPILEALFPPERTGGCVLDLTPLYVALLAFVGGTPAGAAAGWSLKGRRAGADFGVGGPRGRSERFRPGQARRIR